MSRVLHHLLVFVAISAATLFAQQERVDSAAIDSNVSPYVNTGNFSGCIVVQKTGKTVFEKSYALADRNAGIPNTLATRFHVASVSMQFTAGAILRLVDQGKLRLETKVNEVVSGVAGGDKITIRDLLVQRSGLADINDLPEYGDLLKTHQTAESLVAKIKDRPLLFEPGSKYLHEEHSAYNLLALIVEKKTGMAFGLAMKKLVFGPAGLKSTFVDDDALPKRQVAKGYQPKGVSDLQDAAAINWSAKTGNASVVTTVQDQAHWVQVLFKGQFLSEASRELIFETSPPEGYGWFRGDSARFRETAYYMNGRAPGFASFVLFLPKERLTVVVLSNIYSSATTTIGNDTAAIALGLEHERFQPSGSALTAEQLKSSGDRFKFGPDFYQANAEVAIISSDSQLSLRWPSGDLSPLIPLSPDQFMDRSYWESVVIERDQAGRAVALTYDRFRGARLEK